ncbi:hypothetical protein MPTK1_6g18640 [Marchantia polymorpha subsp. ruderalis]|uniref:Uncharacterized protein n=2 Tax=Marchantia polymorpha TaxID=3197 RepID=A0AAF6BTI2_MARPO|nr:hypothetical protein MARPO_0038s0074 [Marchantia polymorpha]BBN15316.1 hypothetical protein Mp_6g18640 [Marchantia polymorpha subsp. ruderalis]|eukprot:PTQ40749.1 hypothetical protein MARPO_0038s0074 [Marchantia polymorpha]
MAPLFVFLLELSDDDHNLHRIDGLNLLSRIPAHSSCFSCFRAHSEAMRRNSYPVIP